MNNLEASHSHPAFRAGDRVVLASGTYQGTPGVFISLRADPSWADIEERSGSVREHPVAWLAHAAPPAAPRETAHVGTIAVSEM